MNHTITWDAGATAQIEFIAPEAAGGRYRLRYTPPYRTTLRSPVESLMVGPPDLENSREKLDLFAASVGLMAGRGGDGNRGEGEPADEQLRSIGQELFEFMLPRHIQSDLDEETFIELALDEELTTLPWEVMNDGQDFLSQRHAMGRFINLRNPLLANRHRRKISADLDELKVLVIGVPRPTPPPDGRVYDKLDGVEPEIEQIVETLTGIGVQPTLLLDDDATYDRVRAELHDPYHIVHYSGHAIFDDKEPSRSSLLLFDRPLTTGALMVSFEQHPALLCFVNGCETSRPEEGSDQEEEVTFADRYNNYGLARSFLETGTYLLGSRWRLEDTAAKTFAGGFYAALLGAGDPVGKAIAAARRATAQAGDPSCAWASYIFYGDPRIGIRSSGPAVISAPDAPPPGAMAPPPDGPVDGEELATLHGLAAEYEDVRRDMESGPRRTSRMTQIARRATELANAGGITASLGELYHGSEGGRIVALAQIRANPRPEHFHFVYESVTGSLSAFEQFLALEAARLLVSGMEPDQVERLREAIETLSQDQDFFGTDRYALANQIMAEFVQLGGEEVALA